MPKIPAWLFVVLAALYFTAARVDVMDVDAAQYAEMSREMAQRHDYLHLFDHGHDYLDKPPMLFWVSSLSMRLFGVGNFGYKLPSILAALLALYATYRLARLLYGEATGRMAALVLGACQGMFLMTNDVRTDTLLMAFVITGMWCIKECELRRRWYFVLGGCAALAAGLMTKGPIALFVPVFAFGTDWVLKRNWKALFNPWHLLDLLIILILLIPMCIGLYQQFDLHPEKWIDGHQHTSGLRFFFWTQSFGRITGESDWDNGADMSFLLVNMLWAFLPWILLFLAALALNVRSLMRQKFRLAAGDEWVSTGGFLLTYLSLSRSHYQLPHYIFVAFPLAAIMVAALLQSFFEGIEYPKLRRAFTGIQTGMGALLLVAVLLILTVVFPSGWMGLALWAIAVAAWAGITFRTQPRLLWTSVAAMLLANAFLTNYFYYRLLGYQAGSQVGRYIRQHNLPAGHFVAWQVKDPLDALDFYARQITVRSDDSTTVPALKGDYVLTMQAGIARLNAAQRPYKLLTTGQFFKVSELTPEFLSSKTREQALQRFYLVQLQ